HTTIPFHRLMLEDETFRAGEHTTDYIDERLAPARIRDAVERWGPDAHGGGEGDDEAATRERSFTVEVGGRRFAVDLVEHDPPVDPGSVGTDPDESEAAPERGSASDSDGGGPTATEGKEVRAEMQGTILEVAVSEGETVEAGDALCVLEAMKMENDVVASRGGTVTSVAVTEGDSVDMGDRLVVIE
ncbi:MAG: biotin/lipoyl-containing protein, partial [Halobacteriales archaeon]